jgi:outer membrane usher protein
MSAVAMPLAVRLAMTLAFAGGLACAPALADEQVQLTHKTLSRTVSSLDASLSTDTIKLESTAIASLRPRDTSLVRLESAWTWQPEESPLRLKLGDTTSNPGEWGSAVRFAGLQFGTPFEMRQDLLYAPRLALAGPGVVPTAADALLGTARPAGSSLAERGLSTGRLTPGANGLAFTARDAAGRSTTLNKALLAGPRVQGQGCNTYSLSVGRVRENYGLQETQYGPWYANTNVACGLGGGARVEAHGEFMQGEAALAGLSLSQALGVLGTASVAATASEHNRGNGYALQMGLQRELDRLALGLQARVQTPDYRELGREPVADAVAQRMLASIATRFNDRSMLALAYAMQRTAGLERTDVVGVTQTVRFRTGGSVSIGANRAVNDQKYSSINLSFARALSY